MEPFRQHTGIVVPLDRVNVDTDQIIPKQFLKRIERTGFGQFLFNDWRFTPDGTPNPEFILNAPRYKGASILLAARANTPHGRWAITASAQLSLLPLPIFFRIIAEKTGC